MWHDQTEQIEQSQSRRHTNRGTVERMDKLVENRPDLAEQVKQGEIKSAEALRQMEKAERGELPRRSVTPRKRGVRPVWPVRRRGIY